MDIVAAQPVRTTLHFCVDMCMSKRVRFECVTAFSFNDSEAEFVGIY